MQVFAIPNNTGSQSRRACDISRSHTRGKCWFDRLTQVIDKRSTTVTFVGVTRHITLSRLPAAPPHVVSIARENRPETGHPLDWIAKQASSREEVRSSQAPSREDRNQKAPYLHDAHPVTAQRTPITKISLLYRRKVTAHRHSSSRVSRLVCPGGALLSCEQTRNGGPVRLGSGFQTRQGAERKASFRAILRSR